ncbi:hypothetical protein [Erwinia persicina]|uniref:Uncharacterized protein n=1 Tax=Erwinia persicina TaxID=55211 RepID=A0ABR9A0W2_9GAMM|nr:hypothetical protein [Erwinia persicina]MBD8109313.1 hypothetical protein [Erwinia persicina]MBD8170022.1 hypothetical protein [Erwinia persicina]MBD8212452.1 hypothetical protein [Erwinia persicina]
MILLDSIFYIIITFFLLGFRFGFALIISAISMIALNAAFCLTLSPEHSKEFSSVSLKCIEYYIYAILLIGLIWRVLTFRRILGAA